jgi:hypothetical protein
MDQASAVGRTPVVPLLGLDGDVQADLLVTIRQGLGVPAARAASQVREQGATRSS